MCVVSVCVWSVMTMDCGWGCPPRVMVDVGGRRGRVAQPFDLCLDSPLYKI